MVKEGFRGGMEKYDFSFISIFRFFLLFIIPFTAYSIGLIPPFASFIFLYHLFNLKNIIHIIIFPFLITAEFLLFIIFESLIPGIFIKLFKIRCKEGEHEISIKDRDFFMMALHVLLYRPSLILLNIFKLLPLRMLFLRLAGLKIGKTSLIPGTEIIYDPYVTEIGEQTLLGAYVKITGHVVENKMLIKKVKIGNNCLIGAETFIFPGAIIEDNVVIGAKSLVLKNQVLKSNRMYAGIPAKEIKKIG